MFMTTRASISPKVESERYVALLRAANAIASCSDCSTASDTLVTELREVTPFDYLQVVAFNHETGAPDWYLLEANGRSLALSGQDVPPLEETPMAWVHQSGQVLVTDDWTEETRFEKHATFLAELSIVSTCTLPLTRGDRRLGVLTVGRSYPHAYDEEEVGFLRQVAEQIGLAIDAAVNFHVSQRVQDRLKLILDLTNQVVSNLEFPELLRATSASVRRVMQADAAAIMLPDGDGKHLRVHALDYPESKGIFTEGALVPIEGSMPGHTFQSGKPMVVNRLDPATMPPEMYRKAVGEGLNSFCDMPLISRGRLLGILAVARREENTFDADQVTFMTQVANQVAIGVENALAYSEIADLKNRLAQEKLYLEEEIRGEMDFEGIVGQSSALRHVLQLVETVAPSNSTVLLLGETGTGKELIARAIHDRSRRKDQTFVKLNCAAIPTGLLESELFGHERGAFTGAISQKMGRFELAHRGTLFLDEVGDIPPELQPKLLRVLQEQEFERLGGTRTKKVDVRLVAATNRDLEEMIEERQFRSDLYYRLNVFPIRIPPLRERPEDIPPLVRYFVQKFARRMNKRIETVPADAMAALSRYAWPRNVRELENAVERAVILTSGPTLRVPMSEFRGRAVAPSTRATTLEATEREAILRALRESNWVLGGPHGAATRLGLKRTTLQSRMQKLGIDRSTA